MNKNKFSYIINKIKSGLTESVPVKEVPLTDPPTIKTEDKNDACDSNINTSIFDESAIPCSCPQDTLKPSLFDRIFRKDSYPVCKAIPCEWITEKERGTNADKVTLAYLAESIKQNGMLIPITVYSCGKNKYQIIEGNKRFQAMKLLGKNEILCTVLPFSGIQAELLSVNSAIIKKEENYFEECAHIASLPDSSEIRELARSILLISDKRLDRIRAVGGLSQKDRAILKNVSLERLFARLADQKDARFREYAIISFAEMFNDFETAVNALIENKDKKYSPSDKIILKDIRIVFNSIDKSLAKLTKSGIDVKSTRTENSNEYKLTVTVKKP